MQISGVALLDYNSDGWMDLFVANDTEPNRLYKNNGNGTFIDEAVTAGVAFGKPVQHVPEWVWTPVIMMDPDGRELSSEISLTKAWPLFQ